MPKVLDNSYEELVEKAQEIFWLKGYKGVSVKGLSDHLNVSQSVIYNKYTKDLLFLASIDYYTSTYSDPFLKNLRESKNGIESLREFFYAVIDALLDKTFPKSCLMVNTVVELRDENQDVIGRYDDYLEALKMSYIVVLEKAFELGQLKHKHRIDSYADFVLGIIFSLSVLYKIKEKSELTEFIDGQLAFLE